MKVNKQCVIDILKAIDLKTVLISPGLYRPFHIQDETSLGLNNYSHDDFQIAFNYCLEYDLVKLAIPYVSTGFSVFGLTKAGFRYINNN